MTTQSKPAARVFSGGGFDPLKWLWDLLTNVKFALLLVGLAGVAGMVGTVVPQMPIPMRGNAAAQSAWLELQREDFGALTDVMHSWQLFDVFHSYWFTGLWVLIIVSVTVCTVSRFRPTWRGVHRPQREVTDAYFERAHHRASFSHAGDAGEVEALLRRRRYRVERTRTEGGAAYFFAERYGWSAYGTFLSHLALLMLLVGALLTWFGGFDRTIVAPETKAAWPVLDDPGPNQIFVTMLDAYRGMDERGNIIDYRSTVKVRRGDEAVTCQTTVNDPCVAFGYKVHQAAFFNDLVRMRITGPDGKVVFSDVLDFENATNVVPLLRVTDGEGRVVFDQALPQMATDPGASESRGDDSALALLVVPVSAGSTETTRFTVAWSNVGGAMRVVVGGGQGGMRDLGVGDSTQKGSHRITFVGPAAVPAQRFADFPGGDEAGATIQLLTTGAGDPYLFVYGTTADGMVLEPGVPQSNDEGYTYTFEGRVEASGLSIRRDPGDTFIWLAVGMAMVGLAITFYVPRRRLWVKVSEGRVQMAGVAERTTRFGRELRMMGAALGSEDALLPADRVREW